MSLCIPPHAAHPTRTSEQYLRGHTFVRGPGVVMQYNLAAVVGGCISARSEAHVSIENARFEDNTAHAWGGVLSAVDGVSVTLGQGVQMPVSYTHLTLPTICSV
eukprot:997412-Rhodomonas_salina.3